MGEYEVSNVIHHQSMNKFIPNSLFEKVKHYTPEISMDEARKEYDSWWRFISPVEYFKRKKGEIMWLILFESSSMILYLTFSTHSVIRWVTTP